MADNISHLAGYLNEPIIKNRVLAAARLREYPFLLREIVADTGLNRHVVQRVLSRLVKQGVLTRHKVPIVSPRFDKAMQAVVANGRQYPIYLYSFASGSVMSTMAIDDVGTSA